MKNSIFTAFVALAIVIAMTVTSTAENFKYSWEGDLDGWDFNPDSYGPGDVFANPETLADGVRPEAITDGDYALAIGRPGRTTYSSTIRGNLTDFSTPILTNTQLSFDAFVPLTSFDAFWGEIQIIIEGGPDVTDTMQRSTAITAKFNLRQTFQVNPDGVGTLTDDGDYDNFIGGEYFTFKVDYTTTDFDVTDGTTVQGGFDPNAEWSQITIVLVGGGSMSPVYIDNFQFTTPLDGDFNLDGSVDAADYTVWRDNEGAGQESALNGNGDGFNGVDSADYDLWVANFGNTASGNAVAVPEPTSLAILAMMGVLGCVGGNHRRC